jgi:hypothetical protein
VEQSVWPVLGSALQHQGVPVRQSGVARTLFPAARRSAGDHRHRSCSAAGGQLPESSPGRRRSLLAEIMPHRPPMMMISREPRANKSDTDAAIWSSGHAVCRFVIAVWCSDGIDLPSNRPESAGCPPPMIPLPLDSLLMPLQRCSVCPRDAVLHGIAVNVRLTYCTRRSK